MKKCPMTIDIGKYHPQSKHGGNDITKSAEYYTFATDCIGSQCAAYVERDQKYRSEYGGASIEPCNEWSCAMMPREVWHSGREANE